MSILVVELLEGKDLTPVGKSSSSSTALFCTVGVGGTRKKSKVIRNTVEPKWDQAFELCVFPCLFFPPLASVCSLSNVLTLFISQWCWPFWLTTLCGYSSRQRTIWFHRNGTSCVPLALCFFGILTFNFTNIQITIKTKKKLMGTQHNENWYPLQPAKSGKPANGALKIRLRLLKKTNNDSRSMSKKKSTVMPSTGQIFTYIRNNDWSGLEEFLETATPQQVNEPEDKTGNTPLHIACLDCKTLDERILRSLLQVWYCIHLLVLRSVLIAF